MLHIAGDGKLIGILEPSPSTCYTRDTDYLTYDYPSVSQINYVAKQHKINIIFAIPRAETSEISKAYKKLSAVIENSKFGFFGRQDGNNVVHLIEENYKVSVKVHMFQN